MVLKVHCDSCSYERDYPVMQCPNCKVNWCEEDHEQCIRGVMFRQVQEVDKINEIIVTINKTLPPADRIKPMDV